MLEMILLVVLLVLVVFVFMVVKQPDEFSISRSRTIAAPVSVVFPHVNELQKWQAWSPWATIDPAAVHNFQGPESGVGAVMGWSGNNKVGVGKTTIVEYRADDYLQFKLEFQKPFKATNKAEFSFEAEGDSTTVTWTMTGKNTLVGKVMSVLINCEKMVGKQFAQGLANLEAVAVSNA